MKQPCRPSLWKMAGNRAGSAAMYAMSGLTLVGVMVKLPADLDAHLQQDAGLSHFEYMVLAGSPRLPNAHEEMSDLASCTEAGLPRLSQVVGRLEQRGLVQRTIDPSDGRSLPRWPTRIGRGPSSQLQGTWRPSAGAFLVPSKRRSPASC